MSKDTINEKPELSAKNVFFTVSCLILFASLAVAADSPVVVKAPAPTTDVAGGAPQVTQTGRPLDHQQHINSIALKVSEAAKTGDYSYLLSAIDAREEIYKIDITEAKYLYDSGKVVFVDARGAAEYAQGHIKGAVSIPVSATPEEMAKLKNKLKGKILVTYCHGVGCHLADKTAYKLYDAGYRNIAIFFGGWPKWNEHKYPITGK